MLEATNKTLIAILIIMMISIPIFNVDFYIHRYVNHEFDTQVYFDIVNSPNPDQNLLLSIEDQYFQYFTTFHRDQKP